MSLTKLIADPIAVEVLNENLERILSVILHNSHPIRVILFGSAATSHMTNASDIDLMCTFSTEAEAKTAYSSIRRGLMGVSDFPIDLICMSETRFESRKNLGGICLVVSQDGRILFDASTTSAGKML